MPIFILFCIKLDILKIEIRKEIEYKSSTKNRSMCTHVLCVHLVPYCVIVSLQ